jgi:hypothetical protein
MAQINVETHQKFILFLQQCGPYEFGRIKHMLIIVRGAANKV